MTHPVLVVAVSTVAALVCATGVLGVGRAASLAPTAAAQLPKSADGHYWAQASVNQASVRLLVDTGASEVALTPADARRLGFDPARLVYDHEVLTAAGATQAAEVTLARLVVDGVAIDRVRALVVERGLPASLLGMSYLGRLQSFTADQRALTLYPLRSVQG